MAKQQEEEEIRIQQEKILLEEKNKEELLAKQKAEELEIIKQKEKEELIAKQKAEQLRIIQQKKDEELLAKKELEEFKMKQAENMKVLLAKRAQIANLPGNMDIPNFVNYSDNNKIDLNLELIKELRTIEAKINDIMLNLDLEGRMEIAKSVMEDIFKSETNENINMNSTKYKSLNYQINNQRLMLEKLLNHSEKYN